MGGIQLSIYRLPISSATRVGQIKIMKDRNKRFYVDGGKIVSREIAGEFTTLTRHDGLEYHVMTKDLERV